jgi:hypothetical protein
MHEHATLIQKSICPDSIVSNSNSTVPFRRLFQHYQPKADEQTKALLKPHHSEIAGHAQEKLPLL